MKHVLSVLVLVVMSTVCGAQQVTLSNVAAYDENGVAIQTGRIFLTWPPFTDNDGNWVQSGSMTVPISGGTFTVTLTASDNAGYVYHALVMNGSAASTFQWQIPAAGATTQAAITQPPQPPVAGHVPMYNSTGKLVDSGLLPGNGNGTSLPSTCNTGTMFLVTGAVMHLYGCNSANSWYELGGTSSQPIVALSPSEGLTFGTQNPGVASSLQVTMNDTGTSYLTITGITVTGADAADFTLTNDCGTQLGSGNSCTISVTFTPQTSNAGGLITWTESAALKVAGNQPNSPTTLPLSGTGQLVNGGLVVTASQDHAQEGQTITLTANRPVNFTHSTNTVGTLAQISTTTATYTAPASIPVQSPLGGCPMFPNDSILNTDISALPIHPSSAAWLSALNNYPITAQPGWYYNTLQSAPAYWTEKFYYGAPGGSYPLLSWPNKKREMGYDTASTDAKDHHQMSMLVAPGANQCTTYETYNDVVSAAIINICQDGSSGCNSTSGDIFTPVTYGLIPGTDAAGLPQYLVLHLDEIVDNKINHPTRITMARGFIQDDTSPALWPANPGTNNGYGSTGNSLPYGAILRLRSSYSLTGMSQYAQNILHSFMQHGIIVADIGTTASIITGSDVWENLAVERAIQEALTGLKISDFDVIDQSSLMINANSYQVKSDNSYVVPVSSVSISASDRAPVQGNIYSAPATIALQGVAIGFAQNQVSMLPGSYTYNFAAKTWVTGAANQSTTWTLLSGPGSVTSGGVYTPPTTLSTPASAVLQATAATDTNISKKLYISLYPWSADGNFRIAEGGAFANVVDGNGNTWWATAGLETGILNSFANDYPAWASLSGSAEQNVYMAYSYNYGDDYLERFIVPNGNYKIRYLMGFAYNGSCNTGTNCGTYSGAGALQLGAQTQIAAHSWVEGASVGFAYGTPFDFYAPAPVNGNDLFFSIGRNNPDGAANAASVEISAIEIEPDSSAAHISIDTGKETWGPNGSSITQPLVVPSGTTAQLYAVGWYMSNAVTWSVAGGGSINSATGLYTAPATAPGSALTIRVTATSTVNGSLTATATLTVPAA
jgi:hypothetical protein